MLRAFLDHLRELAFDFGEIWLIAFTLGACCGALLYTLYLACGFPW